MVVVAVVVAVGYADDAVAEDGDVVVFVLGDEQILENAGTVLLSDLAALVLVIGTADIPDAPTIDLIIATKYLEVGAEYLVAAL